MGYLGSVRKVLTKDFRDASEAEREETVRHLVEVCSFACAGLVLQPVPFLEQAILPIQVGMVVGIAHVYGERLSRKRATEILLDVVAIVGVSVIGRQILTTAAKILLPVIGGLLSAPFTFSVTWATGFAASHYLKSGGTPDRDKIKRIFEEERRRSTDHWNEDRARSARPSEDELANDADDAPPEPPKKSATGAKKKAKKKRTLGSGDDD